MCQLEKNASKKSLHNPNSPATRCQLDKTKYDLRDALASQFGYRWEDEEHTTACSCRNNQGLIHCPIQLPFELGEISNTYLGSGVDECLANIIRLNGALIEKCDKQILKKQLNDDGTCLLLTLLSLIHI